MKDPKCIPSFVGTSLAPSALSPHAGNKRSGACGTTFNPGAPRWVTFRAPLSGHFSRTNLPAVVVVLVFFLPAATNPLLNDPPFFSYIGIF